MNCSQAGDLILVFIFLFSLYDFSSMDSVFHKCAGPLDAWVVGSYAIILLQNMTLRFQTHPAYRSVSGRMGICVMMTTLLVCSAFHAFLGTIILRRTVSETPECLPTLYTQYFLLTWNVLCYAWAFVYACVTVLHALNRWEVMDLLPSPPPKCTLRDLSLLPKVSVSSAVSDQLQDKECTICLSDFAEGENVRLGICVTCHSSFHTACIDAWLLCQNCCPNCKTTIDIPNFDSTPTKRLLASV